MPPLKVAGSAATEVLHKMIKQRRESIDHEGLLFERFLKPERPISARRP